ncbi:YncE family protein [Actinomycetospora sp. NBC_00405]|uniref:YncE family protein n=1 Tax=Actinomycetospora sp. NBC_00405 TaxID=2975952 RepID=UPI002E1AEC92
MCAISRDGTRIYVPHHNASAVSVIDVVAGAPVTQIPMPKNPHSVALSLSAATTGRAFMTQTPPRLRSRIGE